MMSSRAFSISGELTPWLPTCRMRFERLTASTIDGPSDIAKLMGFSR